MRSHDLLSSTILFSFGLFITLYAPHFDLGSLSMPGPGFMPFLAGLVTCIFSFVTFLQALLNRSAEAEKLWGKVRFQKIILAILILIAYALMIKTLGFLICTFFMILSLVRFVAYQTWVKSIVAGGLTSILGYLLFETWLQAQLPKGLFGF